MGLAESARLLHASRNVYVTRPRSRGCCEKLNCTSDTIASSSIAKKDNREPDASAGWFWKPVPARRQSARQGCFAALCEKRSAPSAVVAWSSAFAGGQPEKVHQGATLYLDEKFHYDKCCLLPQPVSRRTPPTLKWEFELF